MTEDSAESYTRAIERELRAAIPDDGPQAHLYELMADYPSRGGKRIRPLLCIAACRAAGGGMSEAMDAAIAIELLHNAFLVHDDIVDESEQRRGRPTLHNRVGLPLALTAGDGLFALALERVAASGARHPAASREILAEFAHMIRRTIEGQAIELGWAADDRWDITDEQYFAMVRDKTAWYSFIHPMRVGTLLGGGRIDRDQFVELGCLLGTVFQVRDDLDNLLADVSHYDKDLGCDLVEAKRTLPVLHLLRHGTAAEVAALKSHLGPASSACAADRLQAILPALERRGSIAHAQSVIDVLTAPACQALESALTDPPASNSMMLIDLVQRLLFPLESSAA